MNGGKYLKRFATLGLAIVLAAGMIPALGAITDGTVGVVEAKADGAEVGSCGDNLRYTLDADGVLVISGKGEMTSHDWGTRPKKVIIEDGATSIVAEAFFECEDLTEIEIASSVTSIGKNAFESCTGLKSISIPSGVTVIPDYAFSGCWNLKSVDLPSGVTEIGEFAFNECNCLTEIRIPDKVTSIGNYAFAECYALKSITIPSGLTNIGWYTFSECRSLTGITIPPLVTDIDKSAFAGCSGLTSIIIPAGVKSVGSDAFTDCSKLMYIKILSKDVKIEDYAFGYNTDDDNERVAVPKVTLVSYDKSPAEAYAKKHGLKFESLSKVQKCKVHKWDSGVITKKPTMTSTGTITYTCEVCGETKTKTLPKMKRNPLQIKVPSKIFDHAKIKKAKTFNIGVSKAQGKVTYTLNVAAKSAKITVSKTGKVIIPKKCKAGIYKITVKAAGNSTYVEGIKTVTVKVKKSANPLKLKKKSWKCKASKLKKNKAFFKIKVKKAQGKVTYQLSKKAKAAGIKVTKKGKVYLPKRCKKGTYKITVQAAGNKNYKARSKIVKVTVK